MNKLIQNRRKEQVGNFSESENIYHLVTSKVIYKCMMKYSLIRHLFVTLPQRYRYLLQKNIKLIFFCMRVKKL